MLVFSSSSSSDNPNSLSGNITPGSLTVTRLRIPTPHKPSIHPNDSNDPLSEEEAGGEREDTRKFSALFSRKSGGQMALLGPGSDTRMKLQYCLALDTPTGCLELGFKSSSTTLRPRDKLTGAAGEWEKWLHEAAWQASNADLTAAGSVRKARYLMSLSSDTAPAGSRVVDKLKRAIRRALSHQTSQQSVQPSSESPPTLGSLHTRSFSRHSINTLPSSRISSLNNPSSPTTHGETDEGEMSGDNARNQSFIFDVPPMQDLGELPEDNGSDTETETQTEKEKEAKEGNRDREWVDELWGTSLEEQVSDMRLAFQLLDQDGMYLHTRPSWL